MTTTDLTGRCIRLTRPTFGYPDGTVLRLVERSPDSCAARPAYRVEPLDPKLPKYPGAINLRSQSDFKFVRSPEPVGESPPVP